MADSMEGGCLAWSSNGSSADRLNYLATSLSQYDKSYVIQLLNQHIDKTVQLELHNKRLAFELGESQKLVAEMEKSYLRRVESLDHAKDKNKRHTTEIQTLEMQLVTFRQMCHDREEQLSVVEASWHGRYLQLSAYTDEYIKQTAALAEQYSRNLSLLKADKQQLQSCYDTALAELQQSRNNNSLLTSELSKGLTYVEQLHSALSRETALREKTESEITQLRFLKAKYEETCQLTKEIVERYQALEAKCIALQQDKAKVAEFGKSYKRKLEELERSVQDELDTRRSSDELQSARLRDELRAKELKHLKECRALEKTIDQARKTQGELQQSVAALTLENAQIRRAQERNAGLLLKEQNKCESICAKIEEFWAKDSSSSIQVLRQIEPSQDSSQSIRAEKRVVKPKSCLKSGSSHKTLLTAASVNWRDEQRSDFTDSSRV